MKNYKIQKHLQVFYFLLSMLLLVFLVRLGFQNPWGLGELALQIFLGLMVFQFFNACFLKVKLSVSTLEIQTLPLFSQKFKIQTITGIRIRSTIFLQGILEFTITGEPRPLKVLPLRNGEDLCAQILKANPRVEITRVQRSK